jgi:hypothetical protein
MGPLNNAVELNKIFRTAVNNKKVSYVFHCKVSEFNQIWRSSTDFRKSHRYQISRKSVQWESSRCMPTDGRIDTKKLKYTFRYLCERLQDSWAWGGVVVKAQHYKSDGPGIDSRWCYWIFSVTYSFRPYHGPGVDSVPIENE